MEIIFPNMEKLNEHVSLAVKSQEAQQEAMKVHEALLVGAMHMYIYICLRLFIYLFLSCCTKWLYEN